MEPEIILTEESQSDESQLSSADGAEAVTQPEALTLAEINQITGMSYKTKDAALKSIKDMKSMAGKAADLVGRPEDIATLKAQVEDLTEREFLARNPEHEANRDLLKTLAKGAGVSLQEATELPQYKSLIERLTGTETHTKRTIANSNNRSVQSTVSEAFNAQANAGNAQAMGEYVAKTFFK